MGYIAIIFLILPLIFPSALNLRDMQAAALIAIFSYTTAFFTFELRLFSKHLWVRRAIVIAVTSIFLVAYHLLSHDFTKAWLIAIGINIIILIVLSVLLYYINDKIEERRLEAINKMLAQNRAETN